MNGLGDEFLAGAALAADKNRRARRRDLGDKIEKHLHFFALADDVWKIEALLEGPFELDVFVTESARFHSLRHLRQ